MKTLKQQLIEITKNNYVFPEGMDVNALADEMKDALTSPDGHLRDRLALEVFCKLIASKRLSGEKCHSLLHEFISDKYLLRGLGEECDDSVFGRAFCTYPISSILGYNREADSTFLTDDEIKNVLNAALKYLQEEKDFRYFVEAKGWADSIGHAADLFGALASEQVFGHDELLLMLNAIRDKICIDYVCHGANVFRLADSVQSIVSRELISEQEFLSWVRSFFDYKKIGDDIKDARITYNRSEFFWSLSNRLKEKYPSFRAYTFNAFFELIE